MMSRSLKIKIVIDILMTIVLLLLMPYGLLSEKYHEWIGMGMFILFVIHHVLNRKWLSNFKKRKYTPFHILQTVLVMTIFLMMFGSMISGIILSRHLFTFIKIRGIAVLAGKIHMVCAYWNLILMSLHLGLHWNIMMGIARKKFQNKTLINVWIARIIGSVIALYGVYVFSKRTIGAYMFLQVHFVFFNYEESIVIFILDYLAVMGLFIFCGHYAGKGLKRLRKETN